MAHANDVLSWRPKFDMSGSQQQAKPDVGCPLDGRVRRYSYRLDYYFRLSSWSSTLPANLRIALRSPDWLSIFRVSLARKASSLFC